MMDEDHAYVMNWCRAINAEVHIRGTDERPVIEIVDKRSRRVLGSVEVKRRMENVL